MAPAPVAGTAKARAARRYGGRRRRSPRNCSSAVIPLNPPKAVRVHEPIDIGDVRRKIRSMLYQRSGVRR